MTAVTIDKDSKVLKALAKQKKEEGSLPLLFEFYHKLLQVQSGARKQTGTPKTGLSKKDADKLIEQGFPLANYSNFILDLPLLREVFTRVVDSFAAFPELFGEVPESLRDPRASRLLTRKLVKAWL